MKVSMRENYVTVEEGTQGVDQTINFYDLKMPLQVEALKKKVWEAVVTVFQSIQVNICPEIQAPENAAEGDWDWNIFSKKFISSGE